MLGSHVQEHDNAQNGMLLEARPIQRIQRIGGWLRVHSEAISGYDVVDADWRWRECTLLEFLLEVCGNLNIGWCHCFLVHACC
jgi:hypothetical protein